MTDSNVAWSRPDGLNKHGCWCMSRTDKKTFNIHHLWKHAVFQGYRLKSAEGNNNKPLCFSFTSLKSKSINTQNTRGASPDHTVRLICEVWDQPVRAGLTHTTSDVSEQLFFSLLNQVQDFQYTLYSEVWAGPCFSKKIKLFFFSRC